MKELKSRRSSKVWQFFTRLGNDGSAKCNLCGHILSYKSSTTNLAKHIHRKHRGAFYTQEGGNEEDPRESLKEFITLDEGSVVEGDEVTAEAEETTDPDWSPKKLAIKSVRSLRKMVKPEVITSNGVDYLIYHDDATPRAPPSAPPHRAPAVVPARQQVDEDDFACFAKFVSKRIRAFGDPYWQSCAINEINVALHRVEMRRYDRPPAADLSMQTEPQVPQQQLIEEIIPQEDVS